MCTVFLSFCVNGVSEQIKIRESFLCAKTQPNESAKGIVNPQSGRTWILRAGMSELVKESIIRLMLKLDNASPQVRMVRT